LEEQFFNQLRDSLAAGPASGKLMTPEQVSKQASFFAERFGPAALQRLDGEDLLLALHGRQNSESKCLAYWLEFKDDEEFHGPSFGRIGGGSALKFGMFQRARDGAWITGSAQNQRVMSVDEAVAYTLKQRRELIAGAEILSAKDANDTSDSAYENLQVAMEKAAPELYSTSWAHKYWSLLSLNTLDDFHSPQYQRFYLFKLLEMPPVPSANVRDSEPRFLYAGRFAAAARRLEVLLPILSRLLVNKYGSPRSYWKIGTSSGDSGTSYWDAMREGKFVSMGWKDSEKDARQTKELPTEDARQKMRNIRSLSAPMQLDVRGNFIPRKASCPFKCSETFCYRRVISRVSTLVTRRPFSTRFSITFCSAVWSPYCLMRRSYTLSARPSRAAIFL
jgi:5-methylcytosine-specific restriction protein B